jgi:hypothetical protein
MIIGAFVPRKPDSAWANDHGHSRQRAGANPTYRHLFAAQVIALIGLGGDVQGVPQQITRGARRMGTFARLYD